MKLRKTLIALTTTTTALALSFGAAQATAQDENEALNESAETSVANSSEAFSGAMQNPVLEGSAMGSAKLGALAFIFWCGSQEGCYF